MTCSDVRQSRGNGSTYDIARLFEPEGDQLAYLTIIVIRVVDDDLLDVVWLIVKTVNNGLSGEDYPLLFLHPLSFPHLEHRSR